MTATTKPMIQLSRSWIAADNFRTILNLEFESRQRRRPSYSRRAFARDIGMKYATLYDVLSGRYGISVAIALEIAKNLEFTQDQTNYFVELVKSQHARSKHEREAALNQLSILRQTVPDALDDKNLEIIKQWYYPAVLELVTLKEKTFNAEQIAEILNIPCADAHAAVEALFQLGVIKQEEGKVERTSNYLFASNKLPSPTIRNFHKQILTKAIAAVDETPIEKRKSLSFVFSFDSRKAEAARARLEEMQREFIAEFQTERECDSIYSLAIQMFPLGEIT